MDTQAKKSVDVYTAMLLLAATFLLIGSILMAVELSRYSKDGGFSGFFNGYPWWKTPAQGSGS